MFQKALTLIFGSKHERDIRKLLPIVEKINSLEQEVHAKVFEINSLKREVNDQHGNRAEIDNLNNIIKKKNQ